MPGVLDGGRGGWPTREGPLGVHRTATQHPPLAPPTSQSRQSPAMANVRSLLHCAVVTSFGHAFLQLLRGSFAFGIAIGATKDMNDTLT